MGLNFSDLHLDFGCLFNSRLGHSKPGSRSLVPPSSVPLKWVVPLYQLNIDGSLLSLWHDRGLDWSGTESGLSVSLLSPPCCLFECLGSVM